VFLAGICCTGASSADDLTTDQWASIRGLQTGAHDKTKWQVKQSVLDACKREGFNSHLKSQLKPMSNAASVLKSFTSRNSELVEMDDAEEVMSPEKTTQPAAPKKPRTGLHRTPLGSLSGSTEDEDNVEVLLKTSLVLSKACMSAMASQMALLLQDIANPGTRVPLLTADNEDNQPLMQPESQLVIEMEKDSMSGGQARMMTEMVSTDMDYDHIPDPKGTPPAIKNLTKVCKHFRKHVSMTAVKQLQNYDTHSCHTLIMSLQAAVKEAQRNAKRASAGASTSAGSTQPRDLVKEATTFKASKNQAQVKGGSTPAVPTQDSQLVAAMNRLVSTNEHGQNTLNRLETTVGTIVTQLGALLHLQMSVPTVEAPTAVAPTSTVAATTVRAATVLAPTAPNHGSQLEVQATSTPPAVSIREEDEVDLT
jgi:hypothetical protein